MIRKGPTRKKTVQITPFYPNRRWEIFRIFACRSSRPTLPCRRWAVKGKIQNFFYGHIGLFRICFLGEWDEWDEWEGGGRTKKRKPTFPLLPHSSHSPSSPRSRAKNMPNHAALPDKTAKENRSQRAL
jgi:hypothetical protein